MRTLLQRPQAHESGLAASGVTKIMVQVTPDVTLRTVWGTTPHSTCKSQQHKIRALKKRCEERVTTVA
jgi:hypothetical protein